MIKTIVTNINELRKPCEDVIKGEDIKQIIIDLKDTFNSVAHKAIGLSANQIGYNKKISYIKMPKFVDKDKQTQYAEYIFINAKIIEKERPIQVKGESCISFRGIGVITKRYVFITVEYLNEKMEVQTRILQDLEAIAVQHEADHQSGIVLFDRKWVAK